MRPVLLLGFWLAGQTGSGIGSAVRPREGLSIAAARDVLVRLQAAIDQDDQRRVATLIEFPLTVRNGRLAPTYVPSVHVLMKKYALVFTKRVRAAILAQNPDSLVSEHGLVRIGAGVATIGVRCEPTAKQTCRVGVITVQLVDDPSVQ